MKTISTWFLLSVCALLAACSTTQMIPADPKPIAEVIAPAPVAAPSVSINPIPQPIVMGREIDALLALLQETPQIIPLPEPNEADLLCMTQVMYFEARGEGIRGMKAVGHVVMNRVADKRFPSTVCGVVKQGKHVDGKPVRNRCQFSWYCDGLPEVVKDKSTYEIAADLARSVLQGIAPNPVGKSIFFHATSVKPKWSRKFAVVRQIGRHIFYA